MAIYAIGDIQGCFASFLALLEKIKFDQNKDQLWLAGDLVHRGGESLQTLEYVYNLRHNVVTVLGNHDLHLIAAFYDQKKLKQDSDLNLILESKQCYQLITWLEQQPLLHSQHGYLLTHAGIPNQWSTAQAIAYAQEVQHALTSKIKTAFLSEMYGDKPAKWNNTLEGMPRLRCITNYFTRMRYINKQTQALDFDCKTHPQHAPHTLTPWFANSNHAEDRKIIFGHWASWPGS